MGTGTLDVIAGCQRADLPEPDFRQAADEFVVTLWRDWLTEDVLAEVELNERQRAAIEWLKRSGKITNRDYQKTTGATDRTALRDLEAMASLGLIKKVGLTGRGAHYVLAQTRQKPDKPDTARSGKTRHKPAKPATTKKGRKRRKSGTAHTTKQSAKASTRSAAPGTKRRRR